MTSATTAKTEKKDIRDKVNDDIRLAIESGAAPWDKPWGSGLHRNPGTGTIYRPATQLILSDYSDPEWFTPNYCKQNKLGFKGAKLVMIPSWLEVHGKKELDAAVATGGAELAREGDKFMVCKPVGLINASQITGLPPLAERLGHPAFEPCEAVENLAKALMADGLRIRHQGNQAYYSMDSDMITMPDPALFNSPTLYYSVLLHEMGHASGHPKRCARPLQNKFGTEAYAFEELIAQLTSAYMRGTFRMGEDGDGISELIKEHDAPYIASWSKILKDDKNAFFAAGKFAWEASDWMLALTMSHDARVEAAPVSEAPVIEEAPAPAQRPPRRFIPSL